MQHLSKIPEYPHILNPSGQQRLVSNYCMSHPPYHERQSPNMFLIFSVWMSAFLVAGSTWTRGLTAPIGLVANDLKRVDFLVCFKVEGKLHQ